MNEQNSKSQFFLMPLLGKVAYSGNQAVSWNYKGRLRVFLPSCLGMTPLSLANRYRRLADLRTISINVSVEWQTPPQS